MKKSNWLETTEYISIAGSVVGTIAAALTQQVVYAAAPVTLSLCLNFLNRQRNQTIAIDVAKPQEKELLQPLPPQENIDVILATQIEKLLIPLAKRQQQQEAETEAKIEALQAEIKQIPQLIESIIKRQNQFSFSKGSKGTVDVQTQEQISKVKYALGQFPEIIKALNQYHTDREASIEGQIEQLKKEVEQVPQLIDYLTQVQIDRETKTEEKIQQLQLEIEKVPQLIESLTQQQTPQENIAGEINSKTQEHLDRLDRLVAELPETLKSIKDDRDRLENQLQQQIQQFKEELKQVPDLIQSLTSASTEVRVDNLAPLDPKIHQQINQIKKILAKIPQAIKVLRESQNNLETRVRQEIQGVKHDLERVPELMELLDLLHGQQIEMEISNQELNERTQVQIQQLQEEIEQVPYLIESLTDRQGQIERINQNFSYQRLPNLNENKSYNLDRFYQILETNNEDEEDDEIDTDDRQNIDI
jgi:chromosome segregation ATPase